MAINKKMSKEKNPFEVEALRGRLATERNFKSLSHLYDGTLAELSDQNTPKMWDGINLTEKRMGQHPMEEDRIRIVSKLIQGENISVLNIGFGSANLEKEYFQKHERRTVQWKGIDISPDSVKKAKKEFPKATFSLGNILKLKAQSNAYDYVVSLEVLEHIQPSKTMRALKEIYRVVKPGKYFIVSVPLNEGLEEMITRGENPNAHVRTYMPDLIKAELEMVGFVVRKEKLLFAFHTLYRVKTFLAMFLSSKKYLPNNILLLAQKPLISS